MKSLLKKCKEYAADLNAGDIFHYRGSSNMKYKVTADYIDGPFFDIISIDERNYIWTRMAIDLSNVIIVREES